jgi:hypothetical protein
MARILVVDLDKCVFNLRVSTDLDYPFLSKKLIDWVKSRDYDAIYFWSCRSNKRAAGGMRQFIGYINKSLNEFFPHGFPISPNDPDVIKLKESALTTTTVNNFLEATNLKSKFQGVSLEDDVGNYLGWGYGKIQEYDKKLRDSNFSFSMMGPWPNFVIKEKDVHLISKNYQLLQILDDGNRKFPNKNNIYDVVDDQLAINEFVNKINLPANVTLNNFNFNPADDSIVLYSAAQSNGVVQQPAEFKRTCMQKSAEIIQSFAFELLRKQKIKLSAKIKNELINCLTKFLFGNKIITDDVLEDIIKHSIEIITKHHFVFWDTYQIANVDYEEIAMLLSLNHKLKNCQNPIHNLLEAKAAKAALSP